MHVNLDIAELEAFDPLFNADFEAKLRELVRNLNLYATDKRARKLTFTLVAKPVESRGGLLVEAEAELDVKLSLPSARSMTRRLARGPDDETLTFQSFDRANPNQLSLDELASNNDDDSGDDAASIPIRNVATQ